MNDISRLEIDTSKRDQSTVRLSCAGKVYEKKSSQIKGSSQQVLPLIEMILKDAHCTLDDIKDIHVHTGPGSYTGLRVGIAIASALGLLLQKNVNGSPDELPEIQYEKDPWV